MQLAASLDSQSSLSCARLNSTLACSRACSRSRAGCQTHLDVWEAVSNTVSSVAKSSSRLAHVNLKGGLFERLYTSQLFLVHEVNHRNFNQDILALVGHKKVWPEVAQYRFNTYAR